MLPSLGVGGAEVPPPKARSQGTISLLHPQEPGSHQPLPQVAHPLLPLISSGSSGPSEGEWEAKWTEHLSGQRVRGGAPGCSPEEDLGSLLRDWVIRAVLLLPAPEQREKDAGLGRGLGVLGESG